MLDYVGDFIFVALVFILILAILFAFVGGMLDAAFSKTVNEEIVECEVTKMDCGATKYGHKYVMSVKCEKFARTISITSNEYAYYNVGDIVKIKVITRKGFVFREITHKYYLEN